MRTKNFFYCTLIFLLSGCGTAKFLKPCQLEAIDGLGKSLTIMNTSLSTTSKSTAALNNDNELIARVTTMDTARAKVNALLDISDTASIRLSNRQLLRAGNIDTMEVAWQLCNKLAELLKSITNPDYNKVFSAKADQWAPQVDSMISKYNYCYPNRQVNTATGPLFSALVKHFGQRKIKKLQKEYVEEALAKSRQAMLTILETIRLVQLSAINTDIDILKNGYGYTYINYQKKVVAEDRIKLDKAKEMLTELIAIRNKLAYIGLMSEAISTLCGETINLFSSLQQSLATNESCDKLVEMKQQVENINKSAYKLDILNTHFK